MNSNLHQIIDTVAARMTETEPSPGFHAKVMSGLHRAPRGAWLRLALACAGLAAVCVGSLWMLRDRTAPHATPLQASLPRVAGAPAVEEHETAQDPGANIVTTQGVAPAVSAEERAWLARSVPALADIGVLVIEPLQPSTGAIAPIIVESLVTQPIELAALEPSSGGR